MVWDRSLVKFGRPLSKILICPQTSTGNVLQSSLLSHFSRRFGTRIPRSMARQMDESKEAERVQGGQKYLVDLKIVSRSGVRRFRYSVPFFRNHVL